MKPKYKREIEVASLFSYPVKGIVNIQINPKKPERVVNNLFIRKTALIEGLTLFITILLGVLIFRAAESH